MRTTPTRRTVLSATGATLAGLAGCTSGSIASGDDGLDVAASFFVLGDFAGAIVGDRGSVDTLVPIGQHGHGWEPDASVHRRAVDADVFVYMGKGFQLWADDVVRNVRGGDSGAVVIAAREGIDLLGPPGDHEDGDHGGEGDDHEDEPRYDDHADHGPVDPHFWLDPRRAATAVSTIADGLADADPDHAGDVADRADAYRDELSTLDEEFEVALADRTRDAVLVAGHNAFQYLGERYDVEVVALSSISPDDRPGTDEVRAAQAAIETHDVEHVLAPALESDRAAEGLVADTDAEAVLPITAMAGVREEWVERDWGYVDLMEAINRPSLATALEAR